MSTLLNRVFLVLNLTDGNLIKAFSGTGTLFTQRSYDIAFYNDKLHILCFWDDKTSTIVYDTQTDQFLPTGYKMVDPSNLFRSIFIVDGRVHLAGAVDYLTTSKAYILTMEDGQYNDISADMTSFIHGMSQITPALTSLTGFAIYPTNEAVSAPSSPITETLINQINYVAGNCNF
jgi:hypothetical protein